MFLTKNDLQSIIRLYRLNQMLDDDTNNIILNDVLETAEQTVRDHLYQHYNIGVIFSATLNDRKKNVLRWCKYIAIYLLYDRIADELVPDRVVKNYNETMDFLMKIAEGQVPVELPRKTIPNPNDPANPKKATKMKWGSLPPRTY